MWMVPANANGLGAHRDWDLGVLGGLTLSIAAMAAMARLPAGRLRGALLCMLPLLVLQAGGWVLVNASEPATLRRARALIDDNHYFRPAATIGDGRAQERHDHPGAAVAGATER